MYELVGLGEILWDVLPDGPRFGGAPTNFGCSCAALAGEAARVSIVSAVGQDDFGREALRRLKEQHVATHCVQINDWATGRVDVKLDAAGVASYHFAEDCAWDHLQWNDTLAEQAARCDAVCFGTLGQRCPESQATIEKFVGSTARDALRILDVNLRQPFYDEAVIARSLQIANVLKLNDDELPILASNQGISGSEADQLQQLAQKNDLRIVALTRGAKGAILWSEGQVSQSAGQAVEMVDTVGAGDAFAAAMTLGCLQGNDIDAIMDSAIAAASHACTQAGAAMSFPDHVRLR